MIVSNQDRSSKPDSGETNNFEVHLDTNAALKMGRSIKTFVFESTFFGSLDILLAKILLFVRECV